MPNKMSRCKTCANYDKEKSNDNWIVCPVIPAYVLISGSSLECNEYKDIENARRIQDKGDKAETVTS